MKRTFVFLVSLIILWIACGSCYAESATTQLQEKYAQGELVMSEGDYLKASEIFEQLGTYSDSSQMSMYCKALYAAEEMGLYDITVSTFQQLGDFRDSKLMMSYYEGRKYQADGDAVDISAASDAYLAETLKIYDQAIAIYVQLGLFKDCLQRMQQCESRKENIVSEQTARENAALEAIYQEALSLEQKGKYDEALTKYRSISEYRDVSERIQACEEAIKEGIYQEALALEEAGKYEEAIKVYRSLDNYRDAGERIQICEEAIKEGIYQEALALEESGKYEDAIELYRSLGSYRDASDRIQACKDAVIEEEYQKALQMEQDGKIAEALKIYLSIPDYKDVESRINELIYIKLDTLQDIGLENKLSYGTSFLDAWDIIEAAGKNPSFVQETTILANTAVNCYGAEAYVSYIFTDSSRKLYIRRIVYSKATESEYDTVQKNLEKLFGESVITNDNGYYFHTVDRDKTFGYGSHPLVLTELLEKDSPLLKNSIFKITRFAQWGFFLPSGDFATLTHAYAPSTSGTVQHQVILELYPSSSVGVTIEKR